MPFLVRLLYTTALIPPKGDSPDSNCQFKCCFLFVAFTVLFAFFVFDMLVFIEWRSFSWCYHTTHKYTLCLRPLDNCYNVNLFGRLKTNLNSNNVATIHLKETNKLCGPGGWGYFVSSFKTFGIIIQLFVCVGVWLRISFATDFFFFRFRYLLFLFEIGFWTIRCVCVCLVRNALSLVSSQAFSIGMVFTW